MSFKNASSMKTVGSKKEGRTEKFSGASGKPLGSETTAAMTGANVSTVATEEKEGTSENARVENDVTSRFLQYLRDWESRTPRPHTAGNHAPGAVVSDSGAIGREALGQSPEGGVAGSDFPSYDAGASWSAQASLICCLNTYPNGITFSMHPNSGAMSNQVELSEDGAPLGFGEALPHRKKAEAEASGGRPVERRYLSDQFHLRFRDTRDLRTPAGRYHLHRENAPKALEQHLAALHRSGKLADTVLYFGTMTDPFLSLHKKFDVTMGCLDVIERYAPGRVVFQTRSPMVISVLPALKKLGSRAAVAISIETNSEKAVLRYTPGMPRIAERLIAADGLRKQGIPVNLQVSPILPYGDFLRDAWDFAELLDRHADFVTFGSLSSGNPSEERFLRTMPIAQKLSSDGMFAWLRPHAYQAVFHALSVLAPEKLVLPAMRSVAPKQLKLFAA